MFRKINFLACVAICAMVCTAKTATAQTTGSQQFTVIVPTSISITPPNEAVEITHDLSDDPQTFPPQAWLVKGNVGSGVNVSFTATTPFIHAGNLSSKRDLQLDVAVGTSQGPAIWTVGTATASTNYAGGENTATVSVSSNAAGRATLDLTVNFITDDFGTFANGAYVSTVVGTVAAN